MSVSAVASSPTNVSSPDSLASSSSSGVTADLSAFTQAQSSGNKSGADAALIQLKSDLASEQTAMLSTMMGSADGTSRTSAADTGNTLLSNVFSLSSNANIISAQGNLQNGIAQSVSGASASSAQSGVNLYA